MQASGDGAAGRKRKADSAAAAAARDAPEPVSQRKRSAADVKAASKAARRLRATANGLASDDGTIAERALTVSKPGSAAPYEADTESEGDAALPPITKSSRAGQTFLDEVLKASRGDAASARNGRGGKQQREDRSGAVKVIEVGKARGSRTARMDHRDSSQAKAGTVTPKAGRTGAVRGKSAAQLLARQELGMEVVTGARETAWD